MKLKDILQGNVLIDANWLEYSLEALSQLYIKSNSDSGIFDGVGIYSVNGPILPDGYTTFFGGTFASYEKIASALTKFNNDPDVKSIILSLNTPGGVVDGVDECASIISKITKNKPITAFSSSICASAGYWLGSAATEIALTRIARLGGVGVVATVPVPEETHMVEIASTISPDKRIDPRTSEGKETVLRTIDPIANIFVNTVAKNRNVTSDYVIENFGKGSLLTGQSCVDFKMADKVVGSFDDLLKEQIGSPVQGQKSTIINNLSGGVKMDLTALKKDHPDLYAEVVQDATKDLRAELAVKTAEVTSLKRKIDAFNSEKTDLQAKVEGIENDKDALGKRIQALEKDAMIRAEVVLKIETSTIVNSALTDSQLPERMHAKIREMIRSDAFIKDGNLDKAGFQEHVNAEIKSWTETINSAGPIQGISSGGPKSLTDADTIATRMFDRIK